MEMLRRPHGGGCSSAVPAGSPLSGGSGCLAEAGARKRARRSARWPGGRIWPGLAEPLRLKPLVVALRASTDSKRRSLMGTHGH